MSTFQCPDEEATIRLGARLAGRLAPGDVVLLEGPLGAGKTTFVKGIVRALGFHEAVRSPTFNLLQVFDTHPPVLHADLFRVTSAACLGIEEYLDTHVCLIEWPDRLDYWPDREACWKVSLQFEGEGREIEIEPPSSAPQFS